MPYKRILFSLCVSILALSMHAKEHKHVLILHSYFPTQGWAYEANLGLRSAFQNESELYITLDIRYLDLRSEISEEKLSRLHNELLVSYPNGEGIDLIMAIDDYAWQFINNKNLNTFSNIPAIFCSAKNYRDYTSGHREFTGLNESLSFEENVSLIKKMLPNTSEILFLCSENLPTGQGHLKELEKMPRVIDGININIWRDSTSYSLKKELRELPENAVLFYGITNFIDNPVLDMEINLHNWRFFNQFANVPLFTHNYDLLDKGVMGGYMIKAYDTGYEAAQMAIEYLKGKPMHLMPVRLMKSRYLGINYKTTREFNISENLIPKNADIINYESSFWVKNRMMLFFVLLIFALQTAFIIFLWREKATQKRNLRKTRNTLEQTKDQHRLYVAANRFIQKELQLPFGAITGLNKMLGDKTSTPDEQIQYLKLINDHVSQIKVLFQEYEQLLSGAAEGTNIVNRNFNCKYLIQEVYEYAKALKQEKNLEDLTLSLNVPETENKQLSSDPLWIKVMLASIVHYLSSPGQQGIVELGIYANDKTCCFYVKENTLLSFAQNGPDEKSLADTIENKCSKLGGEFSIHIEHEKSRTFQISIPSNHSSPKENK